MTNSTKYCTNCKHIQREFTGIEFSKCKLSKDRCLDIISGKGDMVYCSIERKSFINYTCGKEGKFFEESKVFKIKKFIKGLYENK